MSKPTISILNVETGESTIREMTDAEFDQYKKDQIDANLEAQAKAEAEAKKVTAQAKLAALGLTADDLKALGLGG